MTVVAITRVKDERDIIATTVGHMLTQVDHVIVEDNGSTDGTREVLEQLDVDLRADPNFAHRQGRRMSALAAYAAAQYDAEIVVPFDADEVWYSPFGRIADVLVDADATAFTATLYDHVATAVDPPELDPVTRLGWRRREPSPLPKIAVAPRPRVLIHEGNHAADYGATIDGLLVIRHYPLRSAEQMVRKARNGAAVLAATDLPAHIGQHWRDWARLTDEQLHEVFYEHYWSRAPTRDPSLILDLAPVACPSPS